jgi:cell division protein FtsI (penicillin-binding protein 3)
MDVHTGESSRWPRCPISTPTTARAADRGRPADSPLFNRAVQGVYELGSTFKIFTAAQAMDLGLVNPDTMIDTKRSADEGWGKHRIGDFNKNYGASCRDRRDRQILQYRHRAAGAADRRERQQRLPGSSAFWSRRRSRSSRRRARSRFCRSAGRDMSTMTISYGHGLSTSPLHLAAAYATIANGGRKVTPTLLRRTAPRRARGGVRRDSAARA